MIRKIFATLIILCFPVYAFGATYYVSTSGSNSNSCSQAQVASTPKPTIGAALSCLGTAEGAGAGHTVVVAAGTYNEWINNTLPSGTSWSAPFTLKAASPSSVTVVPPSGADRAIFVAGSTMHYSIVDGFVFDCKNVTSDCIKLTVTGSQGYAHHIRISNSEVKNAPNQGILVHGSYHELIKLNVHHNGTDDQTHGIYFGRIDNGLIEGSLVHENIGHGIHFWNSALVNNYNTVRGNTSYGNGSRGILIGSGVGNVAYNNVAYNNGFTSGTASGIVVGFSNPNNNQLYNNTSYGNAGYGIEVRDGTGTIIENNISYGNGSSGIGDAGSGTVMSHNLTSNPSFVDQTKANFKLQQGSSAINAGMTITMVDTDIVGISRPQGSGYDIGAYEFSATVSDSTPPSPPQNLKIVGVQ